MIVGRYNKHLSHAHPFRVPEGQHVLARDVNPSKSIIFEGFTSLAKTCRPSGTGKGDNIFNSPFEI